MKNVYFTENTIVAFHIGRGGRFFNAGHVTFEGEHDIRFYADNLFPATIVDPNDKDNYIDDPNPDAELHDECGNGVGLTNAELESGIGTINRDGEYNTTYTIYLKDVEEDSKEWDAIFADKTFEAEQAQMYLRPELAIEKADELADYINEHEDWELAANDIIERNGWTDLTGEEYSVCEDNDCHRVTLDENGKAIVIDVED